jgi:hypothetical protein
MLRSMNRAEEILALNTLGSREMREAKRGAQRAGPTFGTHKMKPPPSSPPRKAPPSESTILLASELSQRAVTPKTYFRKRQAELRNGIIVNGGVPGPPIGFLDTKTTSASPTKPILSPLSKTFRATAELTLQKTNTTHTGPPQDYALAIELSERALTPRTKFRKLQASIKREINANLSSVHLPSTSSWQ